jgi:hypothetical protein
VVFISTPHRGSFVAASEMIANLTRWLVTLPVQIVSVSADVARNRHPGRFRADGGRQHVAGEPVHPGTAGHPGRRVILTH